MIAAIGDTLWIALGIALNPVAIVLSILIAGRADPRRNGIAYLLGWLVGLAFLVVVPALILHDRFAIGTRLPEPLNGRFALFRATLGVLLLLAAAVALVRGPLPGDQAANPRWTRLIDSGGVGRMFGMGAFVSIVNFRNLVLLAAAVSIIGQAGLAYVELGIVAALFITVATLGVLIPLLLYLIGGETLDARLRASADWLTRHMGLITGVIMAIFGALLLSRGLQGVL